MQIRDFRALIDDYHAVKGQSYENTVIDRYTIEQYFQPSEDNYSPKITTLPAEAANKLVSFIMSSYVPISGEWINAMTTSRDELNKASSMRDIMGTRLVESNFYSEFAKAVKNSILYKKGYIDTSYDNCVSFKCVDSEMIYVSNDSNRGNMRVYSELIMSGLDMIERFDNLPEKFQTADERMLMDIGNMSFRVVCGIIPITQSFFDDLSPRRKGYKFTKIYFMEEEGMEEPLRPKKDSGHYKSMPLVSLDLGMDFSLAELALSPTILLEDMQRQITTYADKVNDPPMSISLQAIERQLYSFTSGGLTPRNTNEADPKPIQTTLDLPFGLEEIKYREMHIMRIFKWNLIEAVEQNTLTALEASVNRLAALNDIAPLVSDFMARAINVIVDRVHMLLKENDKDYKKVATGFKGELIARSSSSILARAQKAVDIARFLQTVGPVLQADPSSVQLIDTEGLILEVAKSYNLPEVLKSEEDLAQEREAQIAQQQQMQSLEMAEQQSNINKNEAQAAQLGEGGVA